MSHGLREYVRHGHGRSSYPAWQGSGLQPRKRHKAQQVCRGAAVTVVGVQYPFDMSSGSSSDQPFARGPEALAMNRDALPPGQFVGEYRIESVIGEGGFGIVYLATDTTLGRVVAIKEYLPSAYAGRGDGQEVSLRAALHADDYAYGLQSFVNEARLLAQFDHPALVRVLRFWEANRTAYMVMPYYEGQTLMAVRRAMQRPPDEAWLRRLLRSLGGALQVLHGASCIHRDIAPDNVMVLPDGQPVLLDFSAARHLRLDGTNQLTAILKPSYAPIEQYAETTDLRQGPWTDVYALAAMARYCILGHAPPPSTVRAVRDRLEPLPQAVAALQDQWSDLRYSLTLMAAIDSGLNVRPQDRPQSVEAFLTLLDHGQPPREAPPPYAAAMPVPPQTDAPTTPADPAALRAMFDGAVPPSDGDLPDWARTQAQPPVTTGRRGGHRTITGAPRVRTGAPHRPTGPYAEPQFGPLDDARSEPPGRTEPPITFPSDWRAASHRRQRKRVSVGWALVLAVVGAAAAWGWQWRQELRADEAMVAVASSMRPDVGVRIADDPIAAIAERVGALGRGDDEAAAPAAGPSRTPTEPSPAPAPAKALDAGGPAPASNTAAPPVSSVAATAGPSAIDAADAPPSSRVEPAQSLSAAAGETLVDDEPPPSRQQDDPRDGRCGAAGRHTAPGLRSALRLCAVLLHADPVPPEPLCLASAVCGSARARRRQRCGPAGAAAIAALRFLR